MSTGSVDVNKVKSDIADLKGKKDTLLMALQNDVDSVFAQMSKAYGEIGENAYKLSREQNVDSMASLNEAFDGIDALKLEQEAKLKKKDEISARYDEEIELLEKLVSMSQSSEASDSDNNNQEKEFCTNCGTPYIVGVNIFCTECGGKF